MNAPLASRTATIMMLLATAGVPGVAAAQYRLPTIVSTVKADSLHEAAVALANAGRYRDAARLYRRSAGFRAAEDSLGSRCLTEAAALAYAAGDRNGARGDLVDAADRSLARGDISEAAQSYLDAAWIAQEQNKPSQVWEFGHRAEILAASPLLSQAQRGAILRRIEGSPVAMRVAMRAAK
jgi:tetratricopeptide (TPR) repeat protein